MAADMKLIVKHTFLEFVEPEEKLESGRRRLMSDLGSSSPSTTDFGKCERQTSPASGMSTAPSEADLEEDGQSAPSSPQPHRSEMHACSAAPGSKPQGMARMQPPPGVWSAPSAGGIYGHRVQSMPQGTLCLPEQALDTQRLPSADLDSTKADDSTYRGEESSRSSSKSQISRTETMTSMTSEVKSPKLSPLPVNFTQVGSAAASTKTKESPKLKKIPEASRTTLILKNLPLTVTRDSFAQLLDKHGFDGKYDFLYVPRVLDSEASSGCAIVNMTSAAHVPSFRSTFDDSSAWESPFEDGCVEVMWSEVQGLAAQVCLYRNNPVMHPSVPEEWKPALFVNGSKYRFPAPTRNLKAPASK